MAALLALGSAAVFGVADFVGGAATRRLSVFTVTLVSNIVGGALAVVLVLIFGGVASPGAIGWAALGGVFGLVGLVLLYQGLSVGPAHLVSPLSAVIAAVIPVLFGFATGERPGPLALSGLALAVPAIWLVAGGGDGGAAEGDRGNVRGQSGDRPVPSRVFADGGTALWLAVGAGVGFGLFFVCLAFTPADAGAVPLVAARVASTSVLVVVALFSGIDPVARVNPRALLVPTLAGGLDMAANALFLEASRIGDLSVVAALTNLYPVSTVLMAAMIFGERMNRVQLIGLVLAATSGALLSAQ